MYAIRSYYDIPDDVKAELEFKTIDTIEDLIKETLGLELPKPEALMLGTLPEDMAFSTESIFSENNT